MINNEELINKVRTYNKFFNPSDLSKAYDFALKAHKNQRRDEGVPYIIHPVAVADILTEIYLHKQINSIIFFNYSPQLLDFNYWCQQLLAESLGKKGKGLLPLISSAPKDHHSLLQLYLDGPKDKIFYIISSKNFYDLKIKGEYLDNKFKFLKNQKLNKIILSQKKAFIEVLKKKNIPYREIHVNDFSERALGELFSYFMLETAMIAKLINVNPFDQPSVEEVKVLTKKFLC